MLKLFTLTVLAFAVSLDSFGVGLTYGIRKIRIPFKSIAIITFCSAMMIIISMQLGSVLMSLMSPETVKRIGPIILIAVGGWTLLQVLCKQDKDEVPLKREKTVLKLEIRSLGLVVHILKKPTAADVDGSGVISPLEATFLGVALSLDAFGAGIGAAMVGFSPWITAFLIALMSGLFLAIGLRFGQWASHLKWIRNVVYLPGCLLILIGLLKLF